MAADPAGYTIPNVSSWTCPVIDPRFEIVHRVIKYRIEYELSIRILRWTLAHSKGKGQDHAHFDCGYIISGG